MCTATTTAQVHQLLHKFLSIFQVLKKHSFAILPRTWFESTLSACLYIQPTTHSTKSRPFLHILPFADKPINFNQWFDIRDGKKKIDTTWNWEMCVSVCIRELGRYK